MELTTPTQKYYDRAGVVSFAHELGLTHITENSVNSAAYHNDRPLKRTKVHGRIYYAQRDIEAWLTGDRLED